MSATLQSEAANYLKKLGIDYEELTKDELDIFEVSFTRQFVQPFPQREIVDIFVRHKREILMGAMVAKAQMDTAFDGMFPGSNKIGMGEIRACYLGIGDDWEDIYRATGGTAYWTPGSSRNWVHAGTTYLAGTAGNAVRIFENQVTIIVAVGSKHPSPKLESVYFEVDGKPKPIVNCHFGPKLAAFGCIPIKELDDAILLRENTEFLAKVFFSDYMPEAVTQVIDFPYLLGASFIKEPQLRVHDPYSLIGTAAARDAHLLVKPV